MILKKLQRHKMRFSTFSSGLSSVIIKKVALLKTVDSFRYILSLFRSHHLMAGQTEFLLVDAFGDGQGKLVP